MHGRWILDNNTFTCTLILCIFLPLHIVNDTPMCTLFTEPIIKPVSKKKFFHAEQDLPTTNYDVEYVQCKTITNYRTGCLII